MAATLSLDTLTSGGSGITVLAGKTLTVEGVSVTAGSTNVQRAIADVTIGTTAGYEVAGKSEVVVAANAASSNRTITLPAVGAVGMSTCIITVVADADATSTYQLKVQDAATAEVWTGYQTGDFVRLIVSNSAWVVVDHKETFFSARYLTSPITVAASSILKITGFTNVTEAGQAWDNANNKFVTPFAGYCDVRWLLSNYESTIDANHSLIPALYVGGSLAYAGSIAYGASSHNHGDFTMSRNFKVAAGVDIEFYSRSLQTTAYANIAKSGADATQFSVNFTRAY
jgi:hypothetical protein